LNRHRHHNSKHVLGASPTGVLNGKLNIKKYYFGFFIFILHTPKKVLNKMLKYIFSLTNDISTYLLKNQNQQSGPITKLKQLNIVM